MNSTSRRLVDAACEALVASRPRTIAPDPEQLARVATAAVLRELASVPAADELDALAGGPDRDWPLSEDLRRLATEVEATP